VKPKEPPQENINEVNGITTRINVTDTLASKILLGVSGNVPAYDRYFKDALTLFGIRTQFDELSLKGLVHFYKHNQQGFEKNRDLFSKDGVSYTPMKLIDMYFWQIGFMLDNPDKYEEEITIVNEFAEQYKPLKRSF
jgi:hypothetical protein